MHPLRSSAVVGWLDVFTRNEYKDLFLESVRFCQKEKGLEIHAWCIMTSPIHLVFRSVKGQKPELLIGDLKRFTSKDMGVVNTPLNYKTFRVNKAKNPSSRADQLTKFLEQNLNVHYGRDQKIMDFMTDQIQPVVPVN